MKRNSQPHSRGQPLPSTMAEILAEQLAQSQRIPSPRSRHLNRLEPKKKSEEKADSVPQLNGEPEWSETEPPNSHPTPTGSGAREAVERYFVDETPMETNSYVGLLSRADHLLAWLWAEGFMVVPIEDGK